MSLQLDNKQKFALLTLATGVVSGVWSDEGDMEMERVRQRRRGRGGGGGVRWRHKVTDRLQGSQTQSAIHALITRQKYES